MKIYILFQTDIYKYRPSRVCFGIFETFELADKAAKLENLYTDDAEVEIVEVNLNEFKEI